MNPFLSHTETEPAPIGTIDSTELETLEAETTDALEALCAWVEGDGAQADARKFGRIIADKLRARRERAREERIAEAAE